MRLRRGVFAYTGGKLYITNTMMSCGEGEDADSVYIASAVEGASFRLVGNVPYGKTALAHRKVEKSVGIRFKGEVML